MLWRLVHHDQRAPLPLLTEYLGMGFVFPSRHPPVDGAHIVSGLICPDLGEVDATPAQLGQAVTGLTAHDAGRVRRGGQAAVAQSQQVSQLDVSAP